MIKKTLYSRFRCLTPVYPLLKAIVPRWVQIAMRRRVARALRPSVSETWPISDPTSAPPPGWAGWPDGKQFALVLTHDVDSTRGQERCRQLADMEKDLGFRSSFNFVPKGYRVSPELRSFLADDGFEVGVHGLLHDWQYFKSKKVFRRRAVDINRYLHDWGSVGYRSPCMLHNLEWICDLDIEYDASTFDTDPFEPQPDAAETIFPFFVRNGIRQKRYVELPYTVPQDFTVFILLEEKGIDVWKRKIDWVARHGGMVLLITHPDYMNFGPKGPAVDEYPAGLYKELLEYIKAAYKDEYWHVLPRQMARFWCESGTGDDRTAARPERRPGIGACMLSYSFYENDNRVMRYAEALAKRGDRVDVIALRKEGLPSYEEINGVHLYRIQKRVANERGKLTYLIKLLRFFLHSALFVTRKNMEAPYDLIHVHSVPDFEVFAALVPKLCGARIILDIHDIVPEFYASKFHKDGKSLVFKMLVAVEKASLAFSDYAIISNHLWFRTLCRRSVSETKCMPIMNYPDETVFIRRERKRKDDAFLIIYPGTFGWHQGLDIAIRAFALVSGLAPQAQFHIYGRGSEQERLETLIRDLGLESRVFLRPMLPVEKIVDIIADADLGIVPKRNDPFGGDAFSTKVLEFMMMGVPVIVSNTRIDTHYFNDSVVKFFPAGDEKALADSMLELIRRPDLRKQLTENALRFVDEFRWSSHQLTYLNLVDRLVEKGGPGE